MQAQIKYLALGDSYSIGEGVEEKDRWPVQLSAQLKGQGIEFDDVDIIARTGWTTDELLDAINDKLPGKDYDLVSLLIGVNNQYRGYPIEQYKKEFLRLLRIAIQCAKSNPSKVFVLSIPDYGVTPFAQTKDSKRIALEIDEYNLIAKNICKEKNVLFFDITPISRDLRSAPKALVADDLHPSAFQYHKWVNHIVETLTGVLNR